MNASSFSFTRINKSKPHSLSSSLLAKPACAMIYPLAEPKLKTNPVRNQFDEITPQVSVQDVCARVRSSVLYLCVG